MYFEENVSTTTSAHSNNNLSLRLEDILTLAKELDEKYNDIPLAVVVGCNPLIIADGITKLQYSGDTYKKGTYLIVHDSLWHRMKLEIEEITHKEERLGLFDCVCGIPILHDTEMAENLLKETLLKYAEKQAFSFRKSIWGTPLLVDPAYNKIIGC